MYILDTKQRIKKTIVIYFFISIAAIIFNRVYALFSHGVASTYMGMMFLYPVIGGVGSYMAFAVLIKDKQSGKLRLLFNIYNLGIAILTIGSLLHGIMEIAGTSSGYIIYYTVIGWSLVIASIGIILIGAFTRVKT